jgi:hypothetical protein
VRIADFQKAGAFSKFGDVSFDGEGAELVILTTVGAHGKQCTDRRRFQI